MSVPAIGPLCAMAIQAFAPPMESFRRGRDFAAWLGLIPRQSSTGGKSKLGKISKMGQRPPAAVGFRRDGDSQLGGAAWRHGRTRGWPASRACLVAVALANRMARIAWALMTNNEHYRAPAVTA